METITFSMRGESYSLSLSEFATHMGIYAVEELPKHIGSKVNISDVERAQLWHQLTGMNLYLADEFLRMSGRQSNQAISGGAFITRLARGLGVDTDDLTVVGHNLGLSLQTLKNIKVAGSDRGRHILLTITGREWLEGEIDGANFGVYDISMTETLLQYHHMFRTSGAKFKTGPSQPSPPIFQQPLHTEPPPPQTEGSSYDLLPYQPYYPP